MAVIEELPEEQPASSSADLDHEYEVFLSFRGEDTRLGFTAHLHKALVEANISTFLDDESMETGDDLKPELEKAIKESLASVIVISKDYASSTWCLNELLMILEQRRKFGMIVLPIFYHVDPSHVRKQEDSFAEAMKKHEKGIETETDMEKKVQRSHNLKLWKEALTEVADLKGKDIKGWHEPTFIQQIVSEIERRLERKVSITSKDLIGMSSEVREIELWLHDGSVKNVDFLTIWGMGGIGKSSLAQYIYDKNFQMFERSCFLENMSTYVKTDGILCLQKQLLKYIKGKQDISSVKEGTIMIERVLRNKRVFLVLDDVNKVEQLDALLGTKGFRPGSKIIITTRDRLLPKNCEVWNTDVPSKNYTEHLLEGLDMKASLELLIRHAFTSTSPKEGYEDLSREAAMYCDGHPLALKLLGSSLFERGVAAWEDTLELLEEESDPDIESVLLISFNSLKYENDKKLFKFIACFFAGKDTDYIEKVLRECGIKTSSGIPNLNDKCLVTVKSSKQVEVHRLLQEMARHIVHQESLGQPWEHSLLCCHEDSYNLLIEEKGTEKQQGLLLDIQVLEKERLGGYNSDKEGNFEDRPNGWIQILMSIFWWLFGWLVLLCSTYSPDEGNLRTEAFTEMNNLALLQLNFVQLTGSYNKLPKCLRWLCWHGFSSQYIPPDLPMANIVVLDMSHSKLERLWKTPKVLALLKILDLSDSVKLIRTGNLSGFPNLERLILARCSSLVEICESIGKLHGLTLLDLTYCVKLTKLPKNMKNLRKMNTLLLEGCPNLFKIFTDETRSMGVVPRSPQSSWRLLPSTIVKLSLSGNNLHNESFPKDFSSLSSLVDLDLSWNPMESLPDCVRSLTKIKYLDIYSCYKLRSVLDLPSTIISLDVSACKSLEKITFHPSHSKVLDIETEPCDKLMEAQGFFKLESIEKVGKKITDRLGWSNFHFLEHRQDNLPSPLMLYEYGIFSAYFLDNQVPHWFTNKSNGSSISFTVPPSPNNLKICGLNVCFVQSIYDIRDPIFAATKVSNVTKNLSWVYIINMRLLLNPVSLYLINRGTGQHKSEIVLVTHWIFENNELEVGDEVHVSIGEQEEHWVDINECGINLVYNECNKELQQNETDPLDYYKSWKYMIGGDLSPFKCADGSFAIYGDTVIVDSFLLNTNFTRLFSNMSRFKDVRSIEEFVYAEPR